MTDYDGLAGLIPKIANKAIEWRMIYIEQWGGSAENGFNKFGLGMSAEVDAQGNSKIDGELTGDPYYVDMFSDWRTSTEDVLRPWTELPDPGYLDYYIAACKTQMYKLLDPASVDAGDLDPTDGGDGDVGAGADLHSALQSVDNTLGNMRGGTAAAMYEVLVTKLDDVTRAQFAAVGVLGLHLEAEQKLLEAAREDVTKLFNACYEVMDSFGLTSDGESSLGVIGAILGLGGAFGGPAAPALGAAAAVVGLADALLPDPEASSAVEVSLSGSDPNESWEHMVDGLGKIDTSIHDQESDLASRLNGVRGLVAGKPAFDLSKVTGDGSDPAGLDDGNLIDLDLGGLEYMVENPLPAANADLLTIASSLEGLSPEYALSRPASIGYTSTGIYPVWEGLRDEVANAIVGTAGELNELRAVVIKVLGDHQVTDIDQSKVYVDHSNDTAQTPYYSGLGGRNIPY